MFFVDKVAIALISPLGSGILAGIFALLFVLSGRNRLGIFVGTMGFCWVLLWSLPVVSSWLIGRIEQDYPPPNLTSLPQKPAIVVLGGGISASGLPISAGQPFNLGDASDRVWLGSRLYSMGKAQLLVLSGGGMPGQAEAESMANFAVDLGVPAEAIMMENQSRNTRENALFTRAVLKKQGISSILLVTSASHMARAKQHFIDVGFDVQPVATDFNAPLLAQLYCCIPDTRALDASGRAFKEIVGQFIFTE